jgi:hypothetical protein
MERVVGQLRSVERKSRRPEWLVAEETTPSMALGTGPSTRLGTGPSTRLGTSWLEEAMEKTGTEGERPMAGRRPVMARVAEQLRLIK